MPGPRGVGTGVGPGWVNNKAYLFALMCCVTNADHFNTQQTNTRSASSYCWVSRTVSASLAGTMYRVCGGHWATVPSARMKHVAATPIGSTACPAALLLRRIVTHRDRVFVNM